MQKIILIIALSSISICFAITGEDLSNRIIIDGFSHDFTVDEEILTDSLGSLLESPADSYWGEYNDVKQIKVTWDASYLYLAVDACSWDNNVMLFIDIYDDYGIEDMSEVNAWQRSFKFYNCNPDFLVGTWDTNDIPQFWKVQEGGSMQIEQISTIETSATFDTGNLAGAMEIKIAWGILKPPNRSIQHIKLLSVITSGDDYSSGPDCAPDNLGGMANDAGQVVILDNYSEILIDSDGDGLPDINIEPQMRTTFYKNPPLSPTPLLIQDVIFSNGKTFAPYAENLEFDFFTNRNSDFDVEIFNLGGDLINFADKITETEYIEDNLYKIKFEWNGRNKNENIVPFGIYILRFIANSGEVSHKEAVVVIK